MLLLLMRHGIAEELREGHTDAERALTKIGRKKTRAAMQGLHVLQRDISRIAASSLLRAVQSAQIAAEVFGKAEPEIWPEIESAEYSAMTARLKTYDAASILLIGHEPGFSQLAARLLTGKANGFEMEFKKSGVCALEVDWSTPVPRAALLWHATPRILRAQKPASKTQI